MSIGNKVKHSRIYWKISITKNFEVISVLDEKGSGNKLVRSIEKYRTLITVMILEKKINKLILEKLKLKINPY
jgi:hypothetical protein